LDFRGAFARGLTAAFLLLAVTAATADRPRLRAERWLAAEARLEGLATRPRECLAAPGDARQAALIAIGRTAFRTPALLGGQAAKAGMSCASCHQGGRTNPGFDFPGLSGTPGTADVTSSLMSSHRGNGVFDPRPIPDLAMPGKIVRDSASPALATFVHGLVTEEFDGAEPGPAATVGLLAYVRAIRACTPDGAEPVRVDQALADIEAAVRAADDALALGDRASARLMLAGARATLGDIDERYALPGLAGARTRLREADRQLLEFQLAVDANAPGIAARIAGWRPSARLVMALRRGEPRSLYDRAHLTALLAD
jgi:cytochrome c553